MTDYALIENGVVKELFSTDNSIHDMFNTKEFNWIELEEGAIPVTVGQTYSEGKFSDTVESKYIFSKEEIENLRLAAYADPITGSDRYFSEALRMESSPNKDKTEISKVKARGVERQQEIKALYPFPETI